MKLLINLLLTCLCLACSTPKNTAKNLIYFRKYDLFSLSGSDTLASATKEKSNGFVKVNYNENVVDLITYYFPNRQVSIQLDTVFKMNDRNIYVYSTGNLPGGKAGKQREYALRRIDNMYRIYTDLSDTLIVQNYDAIDMRTSPNHYHYLVDVYIKKDGRFERFYLLQDDIKNGTREDSLYSSWKKKLKSFVPEAIINMNEFPPR